MVWEASEWEFTKTEGWTVETLSDCWNSLFNDLTLMAIRINVRRSTKLETRCALQYSRRSCRQGVTWRIRLPETRGYSRKTKRREFWPLAPTEANRSEATTAGSLLLWCVHTLQIKRRGHPRRQALLWCASIRIWPGWLSPGELRERGVQLFCETRNSAIHHIHSHTQTYESP